MEAMVNPILNATTYAKITGIALLAIGLVGVALGFAGVDGEFGFLCKDPTATTCKGEAAQDSFLGFDWSHDVLHLALGGLALAVGFAGAMASYVRLYAQMFGVVYIALGVAAFFVADFGLIHFELGENLIHLLIGAWGIVAGFFGTGSVSAGAVTPAGVARRP